MNGADDDKDYLGYAASSDPGLAGSADSDDEEFNSDDDDDDDSNSSFIKDKINVHYDFSTWNTFRKSLSVEKLQAIRHYLASVDRSSLSSSVAHHEEDGANNDISGVDFGHRLSTLSEEYDNGEEVDEEYEPSSSLSDQDEMISAYDKEVDSTDNTPIHANLSSIPESLLTLTPLTKEERLENAMWQLRLGSNQVFHKRYIPNEWQMSEMEEIIECVGLFDLVSHADHTNDPPSHQVTRNAIQSIFFPDPDNTASQSILLKRGPVLNVDGEERELMLFTNGFMLCRIDLDVHVNLLLDVSSGRIQHKGDAQRIQEQYDHDHGRDVSGNGELDGSRVLCNRNDVMDSDVNEVVLDKLMKRFNPDSDELISEDFRSMLHDLQGGDSEENESGSSFWRGLSEQSKRDLAKRGVRRSMDSAFRLEDVEWIETMEACTRKSSAKTTVAKKSTNKDASIASFAFVISLKGFSDPLILVCSNPSHVGAWIEAFQLCIAWQCETIDWGDDAQITDTVEDIPDSFPDDWRSSTIDWGMDDDDD